MAARADEIILRKTAHGLVPASGFDAETLDRVPVGADLKARRARVGRSKAQAAWWLLCSRTANCLDEQHTSRSVSNAILLDLNMVEQIAAVGGEHRIPMSLTDFSEQQTWDLVEAAKRHVVTTLLPGIDIDALMKTERAR